MKRLPARLLLLLLAAAACGTQAAQAPPPAAPAPVLPPAPPPVAAEPTREQILAASDLPEPLAQPLPGDPMKVTIHRLSNGLTVYISTDRQKPRFNAWIAVRAGSRHDPPQSTGLAHYLEHMLFKGTTRMGTLDYGKEKPHLDKVEALYADLFAEKDEARRHQILKQVDEETQAAAEVEVPNELDRFYDTIGVHGLNAFTSDEQTVYVGDVPSNRLEAWATIEAERFQHPVFRLFLPELEAVYEEKNISLDSPSNRVNEALMALLFPQHPYGTQPTIGLTEHLKNPAFGDMVAFFKRWYVPNNMAIVLAGDIDAETALPVLERAFGGWAPRPLEKPAPGALPPVHGRTATKLEAEGETTINMAWLTVPKGDQDEPVFEVLNWLLGNSSAGLLNLDLVLTQKVPRAGSWSSAEIEAGYWVLGATAREGQELADVEQLLLGVVDKVKQGQFTQEDLDAILLAEEMSTKRQLESNVARVARMADAFIHHRPWPEAAQRIERLRKVTREDIMRVANRYLGGDYAVVLRVKGKHEPPKIAKPQITPIPIDPSRKSAFMAEVEAMPAKELTPEWLEEGVHYNRVKLPAGPMIAAPNPRNDLFTLSYEFELGSRRQPLLCYAFELLERSGAKDLSAEQLRRRLFALGTSIRPSCAPDQVTITVSGIDRNLEASLALLDQWLRQPAFDDKVVANLLRNTLSRRKDTLQETGTIADALSRYASMGKDSYYLLLPSNRMLAVAKGPALARLLRELPDHQHRTLYFGPRSAADAAKAVAWGKRHRKLAPRQPVRYRRVKAPTIYFVHKDTAQAQIDLLWPRPPVTREQRPLVAMFEEYLGGGMGGLVFQEIREARGLAYSAHSAFYEGSRPADESALGGDIGTQNDKTPEALSTFLGLIKSLPRQPDRFAAAKESLDESFRSSRVDPRYVVNWVDGWDELGEESDPRPWEWQQVQKLTIDDVAAFVTEVAKGQVIIALLGDRDRLDLEAIGKIAPVEELKVEQLFSYGPFPAQ